MPTCIGIHTGFAYYNSSLRSASSAEPLQTAVALMTMSQRSSRHHAFDSVFKSGTINIDPSACCSLGRLSTWTLRRLSTLQYTARTKHLGPTRQRPAHTSSMQWLQPAYTCLSCRLSCSAGQRALRERGVHLLTLNGLIAGKRICHWHLGRQASWWFSCDLRMQDSGLSCQQHLQYKSPW